MQALIQKCREIAIQAVANRKSNMKNAKDYARYKVHLTMHTSTSPDCFIFNNFGKMSEFKIHLTGLLCTLSILQYLTDTYLL